MDNITLKKKLSTYVSDAGRLRNVSEEVLYELLCAWEGWTGTAKDFYKSIGFSHRQMAKLIGKAKELKREGYFGQAHFKEVAIEEEGSAVDGPSQRSCGDFIELDWGDGKIIRFPQLKQLMEFIKKAG